MNAKDISINVSNPVAGQNNNRTMAINPAPAPQTSGAVPAAQPQAPNQQSSQDKEQTQIYGNIPERPVYDAVEGIKFDFNDGIRVAIPPNGKEYRVAFSDMDTGVYLYNAVVPAGGMVTSVKKFFIRFKLEIYRRNESEPIFVHEYDPTGKLVMIQLPVSTLGDPLGWFPYVDKFQQKYGCEVVAVLNEPLIPVFEKCYPNIKLITSKETLNYKPYACYYLGLFFRGNTTNQPSDFRYVGLHRTAGYILGVDPEEVPPKFDLSAPRQIKEPYVCIAVQSSNQAKYWNNPTGWREVIAFLKAAGYRVLCMDRDPVYGWGTNFNHIPHGCEDFTGNHPLQERIDIIKDADFFVGLSSGLSWLAWGCRVPVVMISGLTHTLNEFNTPYRVINYHTCNSCWNDMRVDFDHYDFLWCPRHKGTERHFECTKMISPFQVIETIKRIPQYQAQAARHKAEQEAAESGKSSGGAAAKTSGKVAKKGK